MADDNSKLLEGIAYFEKMLKLMPGDRTTLEFLSVAYEQIGDAEKTRLSLIQLAETLLREGDQEPAEAIGNRLGTYPEADAQAMSRKVRETFHGPDVIAQPAASAEREAAVAEEPPEAEIPVAKAILEAVKAEAALIRLLSNRNVVDPAEAEAVQRHLGGLPEATRPFLVSALSILYKESTSTGERAAAFVADMASTPPVPLETFRPTPALLKTLPETLIRVRGAIPFARLGDTLLVALLNPTDEALRRDIERRTESCRFFLLHPAMAEELLEQMYADLEKAG